MAEPWWRRCVAGVALVSSLAFVAALAAPTLAGSSPSGHRAKSDGALVRLEKSKKYGEILTDSSGRTLYLLTADTARSLACKGVCTDIWPPLLTKGRPRAGQGVVAKELTTVKRGSSLQVAYDGHPLYTYAGDGGTGQVNGEGIVSFGGTWYVLGPKGSPVKAALDSARTAESGSGGSGGSGGGW